MKKLLQINTVINTGSTGHIAEGIGLIAMKNDWESTIAYGRYGNPSQSQVLKIGNRLDNYWHVIETRLFDRHGLASKRVTEHFLKEVEKLKPDLIHLHNIHGYYLNYEQLFSYLKKIQIPVVWTLHDCWPLTGHCTYYDYIDCDKWQTHCNACPCRDSYPKSYNDRSFRNFEQKRTAFRSLRNITLVPVSTWLENEVKKSFLSEYPTEQIYNGVDLDCFRVVNKQDTLEKLNLKNKRVYLGVAGVWEKRKGLKDFMEIAKTLTNGEVIIIIGLSRKQIKNLPKNIIGIERTENVKELVQFYNSADAMINPTWEDNFPTVNIEALACGTPVITYQTGGSPEAVDENTGWVVPKGDVEAVRKALDDLKEKDQAQMRLDCRNRAEKCFDKKDRFKEYIDLYEQLMGN